jgi:photosystem II stability/assembly factor-like uncharacterized protein
MKNVKSLFTKVTIICGLLFGTLIPASAQSWTPSNISFLPWTGLCASANGKNIWAALTNGPIFFSTNWGNSWDVVHWTNYFYTTGLTCSHNASVLAAVTGHFGPGPIYFSTDSGQNWPQSDAPMEYWTCVASSADGDEMVAGSSNGVVYISTDSGTNWSPSPAPVEDWISVAISADGRQLAAVATNGPICVSRNGGLSWTTNNPGNPNISPLVRGGAIPNANTPLNTNWQAVACSADKSKLVAVVYGGPIYISTNAGTSWQQTLAPLANWQVVASSADGTRLIAAINNGPVYTSIDSGTTWVSNSIPDSDWVSVTSSADGSQLAAAALGDDYENTIYTLQLPVNPTLSTGSVNNTFGLSWTLPGTNFVVQQISGLSGASWATLTNTPTLNLSNLQEQIWFTPSNGSSFFRLAAQ